MIIRNVNDKDFEIIKKLNESENFRLAGSGHIIIDKIVEENDITIAYGVCKRNAEAIILIDSSFNLIKKSKAMRELILYAELGAYKDKCDQLQCFVSSEKLAKTLEKHFGFTRREETILLVKDL